jgi:predicted HicB family RNase H-like nuclease
MSTKHNLTIRLTDDLRERAKNAAKLDRRSLNSWIEHAMDEQLKRDKQDK